MGKLKREKLESARIFNHPSHAKRLGRVIETKDQVVEGARGKTRDALSGVQNPNQILELLGIAAMVDTRKKIHKKNH